MVNRSIEEMKQLPKSAFVKLKCKSCNNEQVAFSHVTSVVKCQVCEKTLAQPTGGKTKFFGEITTILK